MKNTLTIAPFPGAHLRAEVNRSRVAADLRDRRAKIGVWLAISAAFGILVMQAWTYLVTAEAALKFAAGV